MLRSGSHLGGDMVLGHIIEKGYAAVAVTNQNLQSDISTVN